MESTTTDRTDWSVSVNADPSNPTATLRVAVNGGAPQPIVLKGVCYSPCPINASNKYAPNLGDWFWDSYSGPGYDIQGWNALWARDLANLRALGANTIRVYSMLSRQLTPDGAYPSPWDSGHCFTHNSFLDQCWNGGVNPLYVLVGIPLPAEMFQLDKYQNTPQPERDFWKGVVREMAAMMGRHPAVMGFTIMNEQDSAGYTYGGDQATMDFWWNQVMYFSDQVRYNAYTKLVGFALHDQPRIPAECQSYMARCSDIDFWGVNTYQPQSFEPVFGSNAPSRPGFSQLTGAALKPVIITEFGVPATGHRTNDPSSIYSDTATQTAAAGMIERMLPQAYGKAPPAPHRPYPAGICLGAYYFEYTDEWWSQPGAPNIYTWWGGTSAAAPIFPNGYGDYEGFGIFGIERGVGLPNDAPVWVQNGGEGRPNTPIDRVSERLPVSRAVKAAFSAA